MKDWLIRYADHSFSRPLSQDELVSKIESGEIKPQDEICAANEFWFSIGEVDVVRSYFGDIRLQAIIPKDAEVTTATTTVLAVGTQFDSPVTFARTQAPKKEVAKKSAAKIQPDPELDPHLLQKSRSLAVLFVLIFFGTLGLLWLGSR